MKALNPSPRMIRFWGGFLSLSLIDSMQLAVRHKAGLGGSLPSAAGLYWAALTGSAFLWIIAGGGIPELVQRSPLLKKQVQYLAASYMLLAVPFGYPELPLPVGQGIYAVEAVFVILSVINIWNGTPYRSAGVAGPGP
jgi:hypothetical protein